MEKSWICDAVRTPIGRYGGALSTVRADDLGAVPIAALLQRNEKLDPARIDDLVYGCANQAGEDNRNVGRMSALLAGLPPVVPAVTVNRLCGSGMNAIGNAAHAIQAGQADLVVAGGVESMSRAPFVMAKATAAFSRNAEIYDTTLGWRFVNRRLEAQYGIDSMAETAENVADDFGVSREDQDRFALRSQLKAAEAISSGTLGEEIVPVTVPQRKGEALVVDTDEHPRAGSTIEGLAKLRPIVRQDGTITAGNASGINDGACALLLASDDGAKAHGLEPLAEVVAWASAGVEPRIMGIGPVPASRKVLQIAGLKLDDIDVIELNEAFAAQGLAVLRELGVEDDAERVNPNGGAIALGHPLGMSGARLVATAARELRRRNGRYALCTMCIGVGQGIAMVIQAGMSETLPDGESQNLRLIAERIRTRRTTKLFLKQKVSKRLIREAIEVARWAPNHHLTEPWHFYLLGPDTIDACAKLIGDLVRETKGDEELADFKERSARSMPGWLLVTCKRSEDELREREDYAAVCCAIQNLTLYLAEADVACKWTTGLVTRDQRMLDLVGIDATEEFVVGLIWYGYPKTLPTQSRKGVDQITTETD